MTVHIFASVFAAAGDLLGSDVPKPVQWLLAVGVGGLLVELIRGLFQRKKMGADYADVISNSAVRLLKPLEERIAELEQQVRDARAELVLAYTEIHELRQRLHEDIIRNQEDREVRAYERAEERKVRSEDREVRGEDREIRRISRKSPESEQ